MVNKKQLKKNNRKSLKAEESFKEDEVPKVVETSAEQSVEAQVNKKRKLESDASDVEDLMNKKSKTDEINLCEESNDEEVSEEMKESEKPKIVLSESMKEEVKKRIETRKNNSLALFNLPYKYNFASIKQLIPNLVSAIIPYDLKQHRPKGIAYVDMVKKEDAEKCIKELNEKLLEGRKIKAFPLNKFNECIDNYDCSMLVVSNLSAKVTNESLEKVLTKATAVKLVPLKMVDRKNNRTAFAEYASVEDALCDLDAKHGTEIDGLPINLYFRDERNKKQKENITGKSVDKSEKQVKTKGNEKNKKGGLKKTKASKKN